MNRKKNVKVSVMIRAWAGPLCATLLLIGCADEEPGVQQGMKPTVLISVPVLDSAPADMHALVPADALVFVQAVSLEALKDAISTYQRMVDPQNVIEDPREWLAGLGLFDASRVDYERPCALAVGRPDDDFPVTIIVGSFDAGALSRTAPLGIGVVTQGDYAAFSPFDDPVPLGSPLTENLPVGSIAGRVDLPPLMDAGRAYIEMGLGLVQMQAASQPMPAGMDMGKVMGAYAEMLRGFMDAVEALEFTVGQDGPEVAFRGALTVKDGSPLGGFTPPAGGNLADLASRVDPDAPMLMLARADIAEFMDRSEEAMRLMVGAYLTGLAGDADLDEMMGAWSALYRLGLGTYAGSFSFDKTLRGWNLVECSNAEAVVKTYAQMVDDGMFNMMYAQVEPEATSTVDGVPVTTFRTSIDMDRMYASVADPLMREQILQSMDLMGGSGDRWLTHVMYAGNRMGMAFGSQDSSPDAETVQAISRPAGPLPPAMVALVEELDSHDAGFAMRFDLLAFMRGLAAQAGPSAASFEPNDFLGSAGLTMSAAVTGNRWDLGCSLDLGGLLEALKESTQSTGIGR